MSDEVYTISWMGDYDSKILGVYTTLERAKQELAKIADICIVTSSHDDGLSFSTITGAFYFISKIKLYV